MRKKILLYSLLIPLIFILSVLPANAFELNNNASPVFFNTENATQWSGYAITGYGTVTDVRGEWYVPYVQSTCPSYLTAVSVWVGIGGYSGSTVFQAGTTSNCVNGQPVYKLWYEFFPDSSHNLMTVKPGDWIEARTYITTQNIGGQVNWYFNYALNVVDKDTGQVTNYNFNINPPTDYTGNTVDKSSGEWIVEDPLAASGSIAPLTNFGRMGFGAGNPSAGIWSGNYAITSSRSGYINAFTYHQIDMIGSGSNPDIITNNLLDSYGSFASTYTPKGSSGGGFN